MQPIENIYRARHFRELKRKVTKKDWFCSTMKGLLFRFLLWGPTLPSQFVLSLAKLNEEHCWHRVWRQEMVSVRNCRLPQASRCYRLCWNNCSCREAISYARALRIDPGVRGSRKERGWPRRARQALSSDTSARLEIPFGKERYFCLCAAGK